MKESITKSDQSELYRSALYLFTGNDDLRPALKTPFIQDELAIATDGSIVISFDKSLISEINFNSDGRPPNAKAVIPEEDVMDVRFSTEAVRNVIESLENKYNQQYKMTVKTCPDCTGWGEVEYKFVQYNGEVSEMEGCCPTCIGCGQVELLIDLETDTICDDDVNLYLEFNGTYFHCPTFSKIVKIAEIFDVKIFSLVAADGRYSIHKFIVGNCTICIMPTYEPSLEFISKI